MPTEPALWVQWQVQLAGDGQGQALWTVAAGAPVGVVTLTGVSAASIKANTTAAQTAAPLIVERLVISLVLP